MASKQFIEERIRKAEENISKKQGTIRTILQDMGIWEEGCFFLDPDEELVNEVKSRLLTL